MKCQKKKKIIDFRVNFSHLIGSMATFHTNSNPHNALRAPFPY